MIDHPQRQSLHKEVHARPPEPMQAPQVISRVVMWVDRASAQASRDHLAQCAGLAVDAATTSHSV